MRAHGARSRGTLACKFLVALGDMNRARKGNAIGSGLEHAAPLIHSAVIGDAGAHAVAGDDSCDDDRVQRVNDAGGGAGDDIALPELPNP